MAIVAPSELELIGRVALAAVCGATIGIEREFSEKPAGLRTHALVALGAAAFTVAGYAGLAYAAGGSGASVDVTRISAQVVNGIGFLGAGLVIFTGDRLRGLTTAAEMWAVAAMGILCGLGMTLVAVTATVLIVVVVVGGRPLEGLIEKLRVRRVAKLKRQGKNATSYELVDEESEMVEVVGARSD